MQYRAEGNVKYNRRPLITEGGLPSGIVDVERHMGDGIPHAVAIQEAFDYANGDVVHFKPGKRYSINKSVVADLSKVRGIEGHTALLQISEADEPCIKLKGNKTSIGASPADAQNRALSWTEMLPYVSHLRTASLEETFVGTGMEIEGTYGMDISHCHSFNLKHGIKYVGINRNATIDKSHVWNCSENGIFFDECNLHQINMLALHVSYCNKAMHLLDSDLHNLQLSGSNLEMGAGDCLIHVELSETMPFYYEAINLTGNTLQGHGGNTQPLIRFESEKEDGIRNSSIIGGETGNSLNDWARFKNVEGLTIGSVPIAEVTGSRSMNFMGKNKHVSITGCKLPKPIQWSSETTKTAIVGNITNGFTLEDSNDGKVLVANNI